MKRPDAPTLERLADCITLLKRGPKTASEIAVVLDVRPQAARRWCRVFVDKGHARESTPKVVHGNVTQRWEWIHDL
jgi:predicted ArsR family transcriptional regulator